MIRSVNPQNRVTRWSNLTKGNLEPEATPSSRGMESLSLSSLNDQPWDEHWGWEASVICQWQLLEQLAAGEVPGVRLELPLSSLAGSTSLTFLSILTVTDKFWEMEFPSSKASHFPLTWPEFWTPDSNLFLSPAVLSVCLTLCPNTPVPCCLLLAVEDLPLSSTRLFWPDWESLLSGTHRTSMGESDPESPCPLE